MVLISLLKQNIVTNTSVDQIIWHTNWEHAICEKTVNICLLKQIPATKLNSFVSCVQQTNARLMQDFYPNINKLSHFLKSLKCGNG